MKISRELFDRMINDIRATHEFEDIIRTAISAYNKVTKDIISVDYPTLLEGDLVTILEFALDDVDGWISYWIYDLEFGGKWEKGCVTDENGEDVPLCTLDDLWNLLHE